MKTSIIAFIAITISLTSSCSFIRKGRIDTVKAKETSEQERKREKPEIKTPTAGDSVVARWAPGRWAEGHVDSVGNSRSGAKIVWNGDFSPSDVDLADIFPLPKPRDPISVDAGDYALTKSGTDMWWEPAQVKEVTISVVKLRLASGEIVNASSEKVLSVSEVVAADIKDRLDREDLMNKAHEHRPAPHSGYVPKVGDRILGEWTSYAWFGGTIKAVKADKVTIAWDNGMKPDDAPFNKFVPYPTASDAASPSVGDFVLLKPSNGNPKAAWLYGQVTALNASNIEAKSDESTREYKAGDYVVLSK